MVITAHEITLGFWEQKQPWLVSAGVQECSNHVIGPPSSARLRAASCDAQCYSVTICRQLHPEKPYLRGRCQSSCGNTGNTVQCDSTKFTRKGRNILHDANKNLFHQVYIMKFSQRTEIFVKYKEYSSFVRDPCDEVFSL